MYFRHDTCVRVNYQWKQNCFDDTCLIDSKNETIEISRNGKRNGFFLLFSFFCAEIHPRRIARAITDFFSNHAYKS